MHRPLLLGLFLTCCCILLAWPPAVHAQRASDVVDTWLQEQQDQLRRVESATALVASDMTLTSGPTERRIESGQRTSFTREEAGDRRTEWLRVDGEPLPVSQEQQVERRLRTMIGPELLALTAGHFLPHRLMSNADFKRRVQEQVVDSVAYWVIEGHLDLPGPPLGRRSGGRIGGPPAGPPGGRRPLPGRPPPTPNPGRQDLRVWFNAATGALRIIEQRLDIPGGRGLTIRTELHRVEGLDVPQTRRINGDVLSPRRLRTVTVQVSQDLVVSEYEFRFKQP